MSEEIPPTYKTSIFNQANFNTYTSLDTEFLNANYLKYPVAQTGTETIANLATTNDATINGLTVGRGGGAVSSSVALGISTLGLNTSGTENTALGSGALFTATTASQNTAVGHEALRATTSGTQTAVGFHAARNSTGTNNLAIGYRALRGTAGTNTGGFNVAIGEDALFSNTTGNFSVAIGYTALKLSTTAGYNVAIGFESLTSNITGSYNTAVGQGSLRSATGVQNTSVGAYSLYSLTTGNYNVALGHQAGYAGTAITTGSNNTFVGFNTQSDANNYNQSTALGSGATITASNQVVLGTTAETVIIPRITRFLSPPIYTRTNTASQSISNASDTIVIYPSLVSNSSTYTGITYSAGTFTNTNSYSIAVNISCWVIFAASGVGARVAYIQPSGGAARQGLSYAQPPSAFETCISFSTNWVMTAGSSFVVYVYQNTGGSLNLQNIGTSYSTTTIMVF